MSREPKDFWDIFDSPSSMLRWIDTPEGKVFFDYIDSMLEMSRERLERETEMVEIYRRQGRAEVLRNISGLREELLRSMSMKKGVK